jgi:hypothetical protein
MENPAGASTWVFVNQKCNGQIGTLNPKPKKYKIYNVYISGCENLKKCTLEKV